MEQEDRMFNQHGLEIVHIVLTDIFKHFKSIILITLICAISADVFFSLTYQPLYKSEATFALKANDQYATVDKIDETKEIASAFGYIISSNIFKEKIMEDMKVTSLDGYYNTSVLPNTNIIKISATASQPKIAYQMMNSMLNRYQEISRLVLGEVNIELMQNISIPTYPINPLNHKATFIKFGLIGLTLSVVSEALVSYFSSNIKLAEDIENMQLPLLGSIPKESKRYRKHMRILKKKSILITQMSTSFEYIENFKKIRYKLENKNYKTIMVTSCLENEGKTSILANIALALKENHKKVLVIDGDLRKPAVYKIFEISNESNIEQVVNENNDLMKKSLFNADIDISSVITHSNNGIDFILGKNSYEDACEKIESSHFKEFIEMIKEYYDYILIDSAPSALFNDSVSLAQLCDGYILVIRQNFISRNIVEDTIDKLSLSNTPLIGCILNQKLVSPLHKTKLTGSYYSYRYGYNYQRKHQDGDQNE